MHERAMSHRTDDKLMMTKQASRRVTKSDKRTNERRAKEKATSTSIQRQPTKPAGKENETSVERQQSRDKPAPDCRQASNDMTKEGGLGELYAEDPAFKGTTATAKVTQLGYCGRRSHPMDP